MYNFENAFTNDNFERMHDLQERHECEFDCGIDDVIISLFSVLKIKRAAVGAVASCPAISPGAVVH